MCLQNVKINKKKLTVVQGETNKSTITVTDFYF